MSHYEDSFETTTTISDQEDDALQPVDPKATPSAEETNGSSENEVPRSAKRFGAIIPMPSATFCSIDSLHSLPATTPVVVPAAVPVPHFPDEISPLHDVDGGNRALSTSLLSRRDSDTFQERSSHHRSSATTEHDRGFSSLADNAGVNTSTPRDTLSTGGSDSRATGSDEVGSIPQALKAVDFAALSRFVAFAGSESEATTGTASQRHSALAPTGTSATSSVLERPRLVAHSNARESDQEGVENSCTEKLDLPQDQHSEPSSSAKKSLGQQAKLQEKRSLGSPTASVAASSVFSTLSQHLHQQERTLAPPPSSLPAYVAARNSPSLTPPLPSAVSSDEKNLFAARSQAEEDARQSPIPPSLRPLPTTAAHSSFSLPPPPPPAWAHPRTELVAPFPLPGVRPSGAKTHSESALKPQHTWMIGHTGPLASSAEQPPLEPSPAISPLPPPPKHAFAPTEATSPSQLCEAAEAVERLVKAFGVLKGYGARETVQGQAYLPHNPLAINNTAVARSDLQVGAPATVQVREDVPPRRPGCWRFAKAAPELSHSRSTIATSATAPLLSTATKPERDSASLAEGLVLDCVLGLLRKTAKEGTALALHAQKTGVDEKRNARPPNTTVKSARYYDVIRADDFAYGAVVAGGRAAVLSKGNDAVSAEVYANPYAYLSSLGGRGVPLFDPQDYQSDADLYNEVRSALETYVLRRVVGNTCQPMKASGAAPLPPVALISPSFAWALLLDIMRVCQEIARVAYDTSSTSPSRVYPVLVQFKGELPYEEVAKAAMHCLPFEVLSRSSAEVATEVEERGCQFHMACWVTRRHLWTIADALAETVREDIVLRARAAEYLPFNSVSCDQVDPQLLVPPRLPMFTLRPLPGRPRNATSAMIASASISPDAMDGVEERKNEDGNAMPESSEFSLPAAAVQKLSYQVSVLSTDLLSSMILRHPDVPSPLLKEDYPDVAQAVADAVCELLQDESIAAALVRRATEKVKNAQMQRKDFVSASRLRKEQALIDKAERKAEEVVQHILQEIRVQGVN